MTGLTPGSVSPFGLLQNAAHDIHFCLDAVFAGNRIGIHPNDNTATVWMQADDLMDLIRRAGNPGEYVEL